MHNILNVRNSTLVCCATLGLFFSLVVSSALRGATIQANFTDGTGASSVDQYPGIAGANWAGGWTSGGTLTAAVTATAPLNAGGNCLQVNVSGTVDSAVGRTIGTVTLTNTVVEKFTVRLDSASTGFTSASDYLTIAGNADSVFSSGASAYIIRAFGASPAAGINGNEWLVYNGARDGGAYDPARFINSGMPLVAGTAYTFTVTLDPANRACTVAISNGTTTKTVTGAGFRTSAASVPNTLAFLGHKSASGDVLQFSVDTVEIDAQDAVVYVPPAGRLPLILDMVQNNPGEAPTVSNFNDPAFLKAAGFDGKVFFLFDSAMLAVNWDSVDPNILPAGSPDRAWVDAKAASITPRFQALKDAGMQVWCMSDLVLFPKRLVSLQGLGSTQGNVNNPNTQYYLRKNIDLAFAQFPQMDGLVVRIGETYLQDAPYHVGAINNPGDANGTIIPLMNLLRDEICVKLNKKLIFRTWNSFDVDAGTFNTVSAAVEPHDNLIWSIKHCESDFHRGNAFSKVLGQGRHKFIVEVECAREYEGKGAYPNYIDNGVIEGFEEHLASMNASQIRSIRDVYSRSPLLYGIWTWSRGGGWEGPYIKNELWCDLNAWVMAQWALNPGASEQSIFNRYATERLGLPAGQAAGFRQLCLLSAQAVYRGTRSTGNFLDDYWTRDQYFRFPPVITNATNRQTVLNDQDAAVSMWQQIVPLAASLTPSDARNQQTLASSAIYGLRLYEMYRSVVNMSMLTSSGDPWLNKYWLARYDESKANYNALAAQYPDTTASFYVEPSQRTGVGEDPVSALARFRGVVNGLGNPTAYQQWAEGLAGPRWSTTAGAGPAASISGDGTANALKYALLLDPSINSPAPFTLSGDGVSDTLQLKRNPQAADATITVRESPDLRTWVDAVVSRQGAAFVALSPGWTVSETGSAMSPQVSLKRTLPNPSTQLFWKLNTTLD